MDFNDKFFDAPSHTIHYGYIMDGAEKVDEVLGKNNKNEEIIKMVQIQDENDSNIKGNKDKDEEEKDFSAKK